MIKKYLCKNDDLRYYVFLNFFTFCFFCFSVFFLGCFWVSEFVIHLLLSFLSFAIGVPFGIITDKQFEKVYKLKEKEKECEKK